MEKKSLKKDFLGFGMFHLVKSGSLALAGSWGGAKKIKCLSCEVGQKFLFDFLGRKQTWRRCSQLKENGRRNPQKAHRLPSLPCWKTLQRREGLHG